MIEGNEIAGRVTSCVRSPALGQVIGLAWVAPDQADPGTRIAIKADGGRMLEAQVARTPFYSPEEPRGSPS